MHAGDLQHQICIQEPATTVGSMGGVSQAWADKTTVWAKVETLQGREYLAAQQMQHAVTTRFRLRYLDGVTSDITEEMRVVYAGDTYDILDAQDADGRREQIILMCVQRSEGA